MDLGNQHVQAKIQISPIPGNCETHVRMFCNQPLKHKDSSYHLKLPKGLIPGYLGNLSTIDLDEEE